MVDGFARTPHCVLKDCVLKEVSHTTCPSVSQASSVVRETAICGLANKPDCDMFSSVISLVWRRCRIFKRFLKNHFDSRPEFVKKYRLETAPRMFGCGP